MGTVTIKLQVSPMTEAEATTLKNSVQSAPVLGGKTITVLEVSYSASV